MGGDSETSYVWEIATCDGHLSRRAKRTTERGRNGFHDPV